METVPVTFPVTFPETLLVSPPCDFTPPSRMKKQNAQRIWLPRGVFRQHSLRMDGNIARSERRQKEATGVTIKDIARESGYSVSTVSRALNDHPDVSAETKKRVREIVEAHQFVPNSNARQLKQQQSRDLLILVKGSDNLFFSAVLEKMHGRIDEEGYNAAVHYLDEEGDELQAAAQLSRERKPLGMVFLGGNVEAFRQRFGAVTAPCVLATTMDSGLTFANLSQVGVNDRACGRMAVEHLIACGHREIAVIGGGCAISTMSRKRWEGCVDAMTAHGISGDGFYERASFSYASGYEAMKRIMARRHVTAVFAMSDVMAVGAIRAVIDSGKRVPQDISVIGFDGIELGRYYVPKLTSVAQPAEEIAGTSVRLLVRAIERGGPAEMVELEASLTKGDSVRVLPR